MKSLRYFFLFGIVLLFFSCNKFSGSQEIPAYLKIEPWTFTTNYEIEGAATHAITDAWLYVNGNFQGCYEMKSHDDGVYAMIPVLEKGEKNIHLYPGIKMNGISSTRIQYPFYQPYKFKHTFVEGESSTVAPSTKYYSIDSTLVRFKMMEDFENVNNILVDSTASSMTRVRQISHRTNPNAWMDPLDTLNHYRSGWLHLGDSITKFDIASGELYDLPAVGNYVLLEVDYKCSSDVLVGMYIMSPQDGLMDKELIYLRATDTWKKAYVNFSPTVTENFNATYLKFYLRGTVSNGSSADYYFDNIKLIYIDD